MDYRHTPSVSTNPERNHEWTWTDLCDYCDGTGIDPLRGSDDRPCIVCAGRGTVTVSS